MRGGGEEGIAWLRMIFPGPDSPGREGLGKDNEAGVPYLSYVWWWDNNTNVWRALFCRLFETLVQETIVHGHFEGFGEWLQAGLRRAVLGGGYFLGRAVMP